MLTAIAGTHNYTYDTRDRLTVATHPNQTNESYTLDDVGNRTASHQGSSYTHQAFNRLTAANGATFGYDTNGNLNAKTDGSGSWTYTWDYENRLTQASKTGVTASYTYDALGRRVQQTSSASGTTKLVYDGADVIRDLDASGSTTAEYLNAPGIDNKLRQTASGGTASYYLDDHLGTARALADASGNVSASLGYDSYGTVISGSASTRYTYTGRESDSDTCLMYDRARWYDPTQGRFISEDPIGLSGGINSYSYVSNDPIGSIDPLGLASILVMVGGRSNGGTGIAYVLLLNKNGNRINACGCDDEYFVGSATASNPNRMLGNGVGDTPFGTYKFTGIQGGTAKSKLGPGFGTGKILMDGVFGEVVNAKRSLIRLHGGGSALLKRNPPQDPYALNQDLTPTQGCVRMKNGEANRLIQAILGLPKDDPLEFIFVGDSQYLHTMASDPTQSKTPWQQVLKTNLGLP